VCRARAGLLQQTEQVGAAAPGDRQRTIEVDRIQVLLDDAPALEIDLG